MLTCHYWLCATGLPVLDFLQPPGSWLGSTVLEGKKPFGRTFEFAASYANNQSKKWLRIEAS